MSTRCNLIIEDRSDKIQLYRHWDGYPESKSGVLATLEQALIYAWPISRFEAQDFAAAIVRAWKEEGGGNIYIDGSPRGWEKIHGDVEWVYAIKPDEKSKAKKESLARLSGEPIVEVYDWHPYWFEKSDPNENKPKPIKTVKLSSAMRAGLKWSNGNNFH